MECISKGELYVFFRIKTKNKCKKVNVLENGMESSPKHEHGSEIQCENS